MIKICNNHVQNINETVVSIVYFLDKVNDMSTDRTIAGLAQSVSDWANIGKILKQDNQS